MPVELIVILSAVVLVAAMIIGYCEWRSYIRNVRTIYRCTGLIVINGKSGQRDYGPFRTYDAANKFAYEFNDKYAGFVVVDSVRLTKDNKDKFKKVYEHTKE